MQPQRETSQEEMYYGTVNHLTTLTHQELSTLRPTANWVLVKPERKNDEILFKSGVSLFLDTSFNQEQHAAIIGKVVKASSTYVANARRDNSLEWEPGEYDVQEGDTVWYDYLASLNAVDHFKTRAILVDGETYIFLRYDRIIAIERDGKIIIPNGYVLVEPIVMDDDELTKMKEMGIAVPQIMQGHEHRSFGYVRHLGIPNKQYILYSKHHDKVEVSVGDLVIFGRNSDIPFEFELHAKFDGGTRLFRMQRRDIYGVINPN